MFIYEILWLLPQTPSWAEFSPGVTFFLFLQRKVSRVPTTIQVLHGRDQELTLPSSEHAGFTSSCDATMLPWCPLGLCHTLSPLAKKEKKGGLHIMHLEAKNIPFDFRIYYTICYVRFQGNFIIFLLKLFSFHRQLRSACVRGTS